MNVVRNVIFFSFRAQPLANTLHYLPIFQILYLYYKKMISRLLNIQPQYLIKNLSATFCVNRKYFERKKLKQIEKMNNCFKADQSKLSQICLNFKALSPNFFTRSLPIKQYQKTQMPTRQENIIENSYIRLQIPIKSDKQIQNALIRLRSREVRIGRLLECMDSIAGMVGYRHGFGSLQKPNPFILVTACVDSINLFQPITIDDDIMMEGYINHVGKTSMQIEIGLFQSKILKANALFTMVSRNAQDPTKSFPCPKLSISHLQQPELSKAKIRESQAKEHVKKRKTQLAQSYQIKPPSVEDTKIIHDMFLKRAKRTDEQVDIEQTVMTNTHLMHIQERNVHYKIFGGFLMREMIESGWITACQFALDEKLQIQDLTDVYFREPVQIGSHLKVRGRVSYTHGNIVVVTMEALTHTLYPKPTQKLCCEMHMFLKCSQEQKTVYPRSYENAIYYLTSKNAFNHIFITE